MSLYDYAISKEIEARDYPFYALIMAAMRKADTDNLKCLEFAFPHIYMELYERYNNPGGVLDSERAEYMRKIREKTDVNQDK